MKNDDEQTHESLRSFQEVLKRKLAAFKTMEAEVISIIDNPAEIADNIRRNSIKCLKFNQMINYV